MSVNRDARWVENPLTFSAIAVPSVVIAEAGGKGESMATRGVILNPEPKEVVWGTYGGIRLMSVLEPQLGQWVFFKVVPTKVQRSPLRPQFPERREFRKQSLPRRCVQSYLTSLKTNSNLFRSSVECVEQVRDVDNAGTGYQGRGAEG